MQKGTMSWSIKFFCKEGGSGQGVARCVHNNTMHFQLMISFGDDGNYYPNLLEFLEIAVLLYTFSTIKSLCLFGSLHAFYYTVMQLGIMLKVIISTS